MANGKQTKKQQSEIWLLQYPNEAIGFDVFNILKPFACVFL